MASNNFSWCPLIHLRLRSMKGCPAQRTTSATSTGGRFMRSESAPPLLGSGAHPADCRGGTEMPAGEMKINRRFLKVAMPQQHLDGAQVGTGFEQMSGKPVAQSVGMDVLVFKAGAFGGLLTGIQQDLGSDRITCGMPSVAGKQPVRWLVLEPAPIDAQGIEQLGAEHDLAVLASLASAAVEDHALPS